MHFGKTNDVLTALPAVPLGAPVVSLVQAMGIATLVGLLRYPGTRGPSDKEVDEKTGEQLLMSFVGRAFAVPLAVLGLGWLYAQFL